MGYGTWNRDSFIGYNARMGRKTDAAGNIDSKLTDQQIFVQHRLHPRLDPRNVMRQRGASAHRPGHSGAGRHRQHGARRRAGGQADERGHDPAV